MTREEAISRLIVALDTQDLAEARGWVKALRGRVGCFKVGLEAFTAFGPAFVEELVGQGERVFLDLKLHDIPNTVAQAARACARLGVFMLNVHASGGLAMMAAAQAAVQAEQPKTRLLAVTVLTSLDEPSLLQLGVEGPLPATVMRWAKLAKDAGLSGIVCSGQELPHLREFFPPPFLLVVPGIRPARGSHQDQRRVATPAEAIRQGADFIVVGRPITSASDPQRACEQILEEMVTQC